MYPTPPGSEIFLSDVRFEFADVPPPKDQKIFFYLTSDLSWQMYPPGPENFFLSDVRFELADVPPPRPEIFFYLMSDFSWQNPLIGKFFMVDLT